MPDPIRTRKTTGVYGAPAGREDSIGGLPYWRATNEYGGTTVYSVWTFTERERRAIAEGANLVLGILGEPIPPVSLGLREAEGDFAPLPIPERVDRQLSYWCQMCGAAPGDPCTVISGSGEPGDRPGDVRIEPHFYRSSPDKPTVLIPDEPPYAEPSDG